ncbi:8033_t:CDS:1, partial [Cetraspora pellucida]
EGHFKRDCKELKASIEIRRQLKEAKEHREKTRTQNPSTLEPSFSRDNPYVKKHYEKEQTDKAANSETATLDYISDNEEMILSDTDLETADNKKLNTANNKVDIANNTTSINDTNSMETEVAEAIDVSVKSENNLDETPFTTVTYRKQKTKGK